MSQQWTEATIKTVNFSNSWEGNHGTMYVQEVVFEDGLAGEANSKEQTPPYSAGTKVWYCIKKEHKGIPQLQIKTSDPTQYSGNTGGGSGSRGSGRDDALIMAQFCVREAGIFCSTFGYGEHDQDPVKAVKYMANVAQGIAASVRDVTQYIKDNELHKTE